MTRALTPLALLSLLLSGAIFGFFYAWVCSTMWGLDAIDPRVAMAAMNGMNASVRNAVFAPAFFGTPVVLGLTAFVAFRSARPSAGRLFAAAAMLYLLGGLILTMALNVPMNEALMATPVPDTPEAAQVIWSEYSQPWQRYNQIRTLVSGIVLLLTGWGLLRLGR